MSHTHLLYHLVFATKDRMPLIRPEWESELFAYMSGIIANLEGKAIAVNGMPDHVHMLVRLSPVRAVSDVLRELKASSSKWVRQNKELKFAWQRRYGAFSVSESAAASVVAYIAKQKTHHGTQRFEDEYKGLLTRHRIEFDEQYLWG